MQLYFEFIDPLFRSIIASLGGSTKALLGQGTVAWYIYHSDIVGSRLWMTDPERAKRRENGISSV